MLIAILVYFYRKYCLINFYATINGCTKSVALSFYFMGPVLLECVLGAILQTVITGILK